MLVAFATYSKKCVVPFNASDSRQSRRPLIIRTWGGRAEVQLYHKNRFTHICSLFTLTGRLLSNNCKKFLKHLLFITLLGKVWFSGLVKFFISIDGEIKYLYDYKHCNNCHNQSMKNFLISEEKWQDQPIWVKIFTFIFAGAALLLLITSTSTIFEVGFYNGLPIFIKLASAIIGTILLFHFIRKSRLLKIIGYFILLSALMSISFKCFGVKGIIAFIAIIIALAVIIAILDMPGIVFNKNYKQAIKSYQSGDFQATISYLTLFLNNTKLHNKEYNVVLFLCELFRLYDRQDEVLEMIDRYKDKYHETMFRVNLSLLKVSVLFEKGLHEKSKEALTECEQMINTIVEYNNKEIFVSKYNLRKVKILALENSIDEAFALLNSIPEKLREQDFYIAQGFIYEQQHKINEAIECYTKALTCAGAIKFYEPLYKALVNKLIISAKAKI